MSWTIISSCSIVLVFLGGIPAQITYSKEWDVARSGRIKILKCTVSSDMALSSNPLHVYQARPGEAIRRIMHFTAGAQSATNAQGVPARFNGRVTGQTVSLTISSIASEDAGTYYCAVWKGDYEKVFGSGTRLYVSDSGKKPPVVSVYPISKAKNGKSTLLCLARGMFPDLVKFKWKDQSGDVPLSDSDEVLEQRDEGQEVRVSSMLIIDQQKAASNIYTCSVQHESNDKAIEKIIPAHSEDKEDNSTHGSDPNCPPSTVKQDKQGEQEGEEGPVANNGSLELVQNMKLFILSYLTLLAKNVLYFSAVAILLIKKTVGKNKSVSSNSTKPRAS